METKKSKLGLGIFIGVLIGLIIGLSGFIVYDKFIRNYDNKVIDHDKDSTEDKNNQIDDNSSISNDSNDNKTVELSLSDEFVVKMFNLHSSFIKDSKILKEFYSVSEVNSSDLSNDTKRYLFRIWLSNVEKTNQDSSYYYYSASTVLNEWKKLFGSHTNFPFYNDGNLKINGYKFQSDGSFQECIQCDFDIGAVGSENKLVKATKSDTEIILYEDVKFFNIDTGTYYKDYDKTIVTTSDAQLDANYKFIYSKDTNTNSYYFYGIQKIK